MLREVTPHNHQPTTSNPARAFLEAVARRDEDLERPFVELVEHALLEGLVDEVVHVMAAAPEFRVRRAIELVRKLLSADQAKKASGA